MSSMLDVLLKQSNETIDAMLEDGVDPSEYYLIEHHLASQDFTKLEKAAVEMVKEGYHVDDADEFEDEQGELLDDVRAEVTQALDNMQFPATEERITERANRVARRAFRESLGGRPMVHSVIIRR